MRLSKSILFEITMEQDGNVYLMNRPDKAHR